MCSISVLCEVIRYAAIKNSFILEEKIISVEKYFELRLNGKPFRKIFCSPVDVEDLVLGILAQADKIQTADDVSRFEITDNLIEVEMQASNKFAPPKPADVRFRANDILNCADKLLGEMSITHAKTNGVHSGALFDGQRLLLFREDIGRHNVFDKIHGAAIRNGVDLRDKALIFSGRCSSEMIAKVARMNIPVVVAKSVPTTHAIELAKKIGITLVGRLRADSFCIYTNSQRIV